MIQANTAYITVYYGKGRDLSSVIDDVVNALNPNYQIFIDAWFLSTSDVKGYGTVKQDLRLIYPNLYGSINKTTVIVDEEDIKNLKTEVSDSVIRIGV